MSGGIVIDFQEYGLQVEDISAVSENTIKTIGKKILQAFKTYGFCYVKNHGVPESLIAEYFGASLKFFELSAEEKAKYGVGTDYLFGWVKLLAEKFDATSTPGDLHEAFQFRPQTEYEAWPPLEKFESLTKKMFHVSSDLGYRFCDVLSLGLDQPYNFMRTAHSLIGQPGSSTIIRSSYYPPIQADWDTKPDQKRFCEHFDFTTVTCIFQDNIGGLEVKNPSGDFVPVDPTPGAAVLLPGINLQRWTADSVMAAIHRIPIPAEQTQKTSTRQSCVLYLHPDDDFVIKCLDGSDKYGPVTSRGYIDYKLHEAMPDMFTEEK